MARYGWVSRVVEGVVAHPVEPVTTWGDRLDAVLTHKVWGTLILAAVMLLMFSAVFAWAKLPMDGIEAAIAWLSGRDRGERCRRARSAAFWSTASSAGSARW